MESSIVELTFSGMKLMLIGMSIVYLFLALLVWIIGFTAKMIDRFSPEIDEPISHPVPAYALSQEAESEEEIVAAISSAIHRYRND